jgi:hypothetical protein
VTSISVLVSLAGSLVLGQSPLSALLDSNNNVRLTAYSTEKELKVFQFSFSLTGDPEAEFLDEIQTKVLRVFLLAIQSHLNSSALVFLFLQTHATSYSFYSAFLYTVRRKEENLIETHTPFPLV